MHKMLILSFRFITRDEVKQAMIQYKMGDEDTIDEILDDIDIDGVRFTLITILFLVLYF